MVEKKLEPSTGQPVWTSKEEKRGIDPLGMQSTSVDLYQHLLPGISNVTLRMRYYGLYVWLAHRYACDVGDTSVEVWCRYLRRAEALYALVARQHGGEKGVAGILWAGRKLDTTTGNRVVFRSSTDRGGGEPQYLKQKFGAFGAAYGSQLVEIGLIEYVDEREVPVPTDAIGDALALAFEAAIGGVGSLFLKAASAGSVKIDELVAMAPMLPSQIGKTSRERQLYQALLFGKSHPENEGATTRSSSLRLVLRTAQNEATRIEADDIRWTMYASRNGAGEELAPLSDAENRLKFAWMVYQANDLLHASYEALMKFSLDVLSANPTGMPLDQLVGRVATRLAHALKPRRADTWFELVASMDLADNPWSDEDELSEFSLMSAVFEGAPAHVISSAECGANAVLLLAALHKRFAHQVARISEDLPVLATSPHQRSILTELRFLDGHSNSPLAELLLRVVKQRIIDRHLWVSIQKFRGQGDYTFLLESDEGRVRVRQKAGPVLTNPRLSSAIAFLTDIHLLGENGPTAAGVRVLGAA